MEGKFNSLILCQSSGTVMTSLGLQSWTCFESSEMVYKGLQVEAMAPRATMARKHTGKWIELGATMRTTSLL